MFFVKQYKGYYLIGTEYIEGTTPSIEDIPLIIEALHIMGSIKYEKRNRTKDFRVLMNPHICLANESILESLQRYAALIRGGEQLIPLIAEYGKYIVTHRAYKKIDRDKHYSFIHGDFHTKNMLVRDGRLYIIDWGLHGYGFSGVDLAKALQSFIIPFKDTIPYVKQLFDNDSIAMAMYCFVQLYWWIFALVGKTLEPHHMNDFFLPALEYAKEHFEKALNDTDS